MNSISKKYLLLFIFFFCWFISNSQETQQIDNIIENLIEHLTENQDETADINELFELFIELYENPININTATEEELKKLPIFNDYQIFSLKEYISNYGEFLSIYELPMVFGFSEEFVKLIAPFVTVLPEEVKIDQKPKSRIKHEMLLRSQRVIQEQAGYSKESQKYIGSPYKIYSRYRVKQENRFSAGITTEKDAGEHFFNDSLGNQIDYYSAHISLENIGFVERFIVGDFNASFGQGLVLWTNFSSGKSSYTTDINRYATKITPYVSTSENGFLRGVGTTLNVGKNISASLFYSHKKIDGNLGEPDNTISGKPVFNSFQTSGYHNTNSLLADKDAITENLFGLNLETHLKFGVIGINAITHNFDAYFLKEEKPYNTLYFQGDEYQAGSLYYRIYNKKFVLFGENALHGSKNFALINGADYFVHPQLNLSILYRYFEPGYFSLYSDAFGESGNTQNENGVYLGFKFFPLPKISINGYFDMYRHPWLRHQVDSPSEGLDYFAEIKFTLNAKINFSIRYKNEGKDKNVNSHPDVKTNRLEKEYLQKTRFHFEYKPIEAVILRSRLELSNYSLDQIKENGFLLYQDVNFQPQEKPFAVQFRLAIFNTDGYNSRIYAYENDLLYTFNVPAYYDNGNRFYFNFKYKISRNISFYLKYSQNISKNAVTLGSGLNEIDGNKKSEIKAQLRLKF